MEARTLLEAADIPTRVVSFPSWHLFQEQDSIYQDAVLPPGVTARVSVEAGSTLGWERWIGTRGVAVGLDRFGASAPWKVLYEKLGITVDAVLEAGRTMMGR